MSINLRGYGKEILMLPSGLWPCLAHLIYLTEQKAEIEPNNWKKKKKNWTHRTKLETKFINLWWIQNFKVAPETKKKKKKPSPLGACCITSSVKFVGHHFWPSLIPFVTGRVLGPRPTFTPCPKRAQLFCLSAI